MLGCGSYPFAHAGGPDPDRAQKTLVSGGRQDVFIHNGIDRRPIDLDYLRYVSSDLARSATNREIIAAMPSGRVANQAYRMTGEWTFVETAEAWGLADVGSSTGAAVADFDGDGDANLVVNNLNTPASIYKNTRLTEKPTNTTGFGPAGPTTFRYNPHDRICPQRGFMSQSEEDYGRDYETVEKPPSDFKVMPTGIFFETKTVR